uniref:Leucine rich adaptor protein 1 n=1 Tax=Loxodonta africana TaxID=9785 RepID=G3U6G1_LOXAF
AAESQTPDLRDVEGKVGRKTPEGLLRGLRGEWEPGTPGALLRLGVGGTDSRKLSCQENLREHKSTQGPPVSTPAPFIGHPPNHSFLPVLETTVHELERRLIAYLRAIDVKILQQLVTLNEGIEAVRWLLEERGTLTSHCSSLTSSQYSLTGGSPGRSRRGSWDSLPDNGSTDRLDSVSVGSFLDTVAPNELDEQAP